MRRITVSALSLFIMLPAMADTRLPVVNLSAAGVSARAAFGESIPTKSATAPVATRTSTRIAATKKSDTPTRSRVVARTATTPVAPAAESVDTGAQIIARNDVLVPRRPASDLWAHSVDVPLRMPNADEFAVLRSDDELPEESLDAASAPRAVISRTASVGAKTPSASRSSAPLSEFDAQIARLNELQRRADASIDSVSAPVAPEQNVAHTDTTPVALSHTISSHSTYERTTTARPDIAATPNVQVSRVVVPMDDDVVVRAVEKSTSPRIAAAREDMSKMTPSELRRAFRKTFLSENKHLSTFQMDDRFDVVSDMSSSVEGFTSRRDLSESGGIRPLEIKIKFHSDDSALSRDNYNLLTEYAGIMLANPTRAIQVSIPQSVTTNSDARKLAARRLAIVEQVLRDNGVPEQRIMPVLASRNDDSFMLRMISNQQYESLSQQKRDMFGDTVGKKKTYNRLVW